MTTDDRPFLRIGHSPDPDDAFMWFPITGIDGGPPLIDTGRFRFEAVQQDIETLNTRSLEGDLEITAISIAQFPHVADRYALTSCGASMGDGYGPKIVARRRERTEWLLDPAVRTATPGDRTSAYLATRLRLGGRDFEHEAIAFDEIIERVADGTFDAGIVIHEGQLTYESSGLALVEDLGAWWTGATGLPLPLGGNAIRRDLEAMYGPGALEEITATLLRSIRFALDHREQAVDYALRFGRGLDRALADRFVEMYVNSHTLDFGERGRAGVREFLARASDAAITPALPEAPIFVDPESNAQVTS
ncbi:MAG: MqnA/MqnD/SBP family protein [Phycisphaerales bacterium]